MSYDYTCKPPKAYIYIYVYENGNVATMNSAKICISTTMGANIYASIIQVPWTLNQNQECVIYI